VGASERTVARLFREQLGLSYQQWRQQATLAHALPLLARGQPVSLVAAASGYASESAFTAMFRAAMGQPPSHFHGHGKARAEARPEPGADTRRDTAGPQEPPLRLCCRSALMARFPAPPFHARAFPPTWLLRLPTHVINGLGVPPGSA
jgi:AraC-like DNA-binding protein